MSLLCGLIGLKGCGKTTIFKALTSSGISSVSSKEEHRAVVPIKDSRVDDLYTHFNSKKKTYATLEFIDLPGLKRGMSGDEITKVLSSVKEADIFVHIIRCFEDEMYPHTEGTIDPIRDKNLLDFELIIADLNIVERRIERLSKLAKTGEEKAKNQLKLMNELKVFLESEKPLRAYKFKEEDLKLISGIEFLSIKPVIYVANLGESKDNYSEKFFEKIEELAKNEGTVALKVFGKVESELVELDEDEREEFLLSYGLKESGLDRVVKSAFYKLDLITFLTAGEKEARAWTIKKGTKAPQAGGKIHSDIERGFIRVEVYSYEDWVNCGRDEKKVKEKGLLRIEGKDYVIKEGDICYFRFNV